jgi:hypothetical protein
MIDGLVLPEIGELEGVEGREHDGKKGEPQSEGVRGRGAFSHLRAPGAGSMGSRRYGG